MKNTGCNRRCCFALVLIVWLALPSAPQAGAPEHGPAIPLAPPHADAWFLVRLDAALTERSNDGGFSLTTGHPALDDRIFRMHARQELERMSRVVSC